MRRTGRGLLTIMVLSGMLGLSGCGWSKAAQGGAIGAGAGAAAGILIGDDAKSAIIGAAIGGAAGAIIGHQMDRQARELEAELEGAEVARVGEGIAVVFDTGLMFDFDESNLRPASRDNLQELADNLKEYERTDVTILGHTDATGTASYNQELSERRAQAAARYLERLGVADGRIHTRGLGESDPVATNETDEGRQLNRRVEVLIYADEEWREEVLAAQGSN